MYWVRNSLDFIPLLLLCVLWAGGGWLIAVHVFRVRKREQLVVGSSSGLLLFIVLSNGLYQLPGLSSASISLAFWLAAGLIALLGLLAAWRSPKRDRLQWADLAQFAPQAAFLAAILIVFALIQRGLAIFDDYHNLPLTSMIAAGDLPPHFYLNPHQRLAYHYGLHVFAASLVRMGGFYPWSAFDFSKALSITLTLGLTWLWFRRLMRNSTAATWGAGLILVAGGARWLLLFLPANWLIQIGSSLHLLGSGLQSGPDLYTALANPWKIGGGGPFPFPFAFANGLFPSLIFAIGGPGALPQMTLLLLLILGHKVEKGCAALIYCLLLSSLALSAEHVFILVWLGLFVTAGLAWRRKGKGIYLGRWAGVLLGALLLALISGGVITEAGRSFLSAQRVTSSPESVGFSGFGLRWPPALISAHLGALELFRPEHWIVALAEIGPLIFLAPWLIRRTWRQARLAHIPVAGLSLAAAMGFFLPMILRYGVERDITRFNYMALFIWLILGFPYLWLVWQRGRSSVRALLGVGGFVLVFGGMTNLALQLIAIPRPQFTYFVDKSDVVMSQRYWDRLEPDAQVLDFVAVRAVTLFGRSGGEAFLDYIYYTPLPQRQSLMTDFDPLRIREAGYAYIYLDRHSWQELSPQEQQALEQPCVKRLEGSTAGEDFRWLLDIRACR